MNIGKITDVFKLTGLFLLSNIAGILFLLGLAVIDVAVYMYSENLGIVATGVSLILVALILNSEQRQ